MDASVSLGDDHRLEEKNMRSWTARNIEKMIKKEMKKL